MAEGSVCAEGWLREGRPGASLSCPRSRRCVGVGGMSDPSNNSQSSLPYGLDTIKPGAVRMMTTDKLASFSLGGTKKTPYQVGAHAPNAAHGWAEAAPPNISRVCARAPPQQKLKEAKEAKRKEQEEAAQAELNNWVEQFESGDNQDRSKTFVRGGVQGGSVGRSGSSALPSREGGATFKREASAGARSMFSQFDGESRDRRPPCVHSHPAICARARRPARLRPRRCSFHVAQRKTSMERPLPSRRRQEGAPVPLPLPPQR